MTHGYHIIIIENTKLDHYSALWRDALHMRHSPAVAADASPRAEARGCQHGVLRALDHYSMDGVRTDGSLQLLHID